MTFHYSASFDIDDPKYGFSTIALSRSGSSTISVNIGNLTGTTGDASYVYNTVFNHYPTPLSDALGPDAVENAGLANTQVAYSFAFLVQSYLRSAATVAGWPSPNNITVSFSTSTLRYTIAHSGALTAITFGNGLTGSLFGMSNFSGSSSSVVGANLPRHIIQPILDDVSTTNDGVMYEPRGIAATARLSNGRQFSLTRPCVPIYRDWTQQFENKARTYRLNNVSHGYSHQQLFEDCRSVHPFVLVDAFNDGFDSVYYLRSDGADFGKGVVQRAGGSEDDAQFHVAYRTQLVGIFEGPG